ncbi:MAG: hypothetical protein RJB66_2640 [Pseudomonadota bacterium]|jgi:AcrR family transcriptional regulator
MKLSKSLPYNTTSKIKGAAKSLFANKGFDSVTVKEIGLKSRSNPALINYHFGGKKELYYAILEDFTQIGRESTRAILKTPQTKHDFIENLNLYIHHLLNRYLQDPELYLLLNRECEKVLSKSILHRFENQLLDVFRMLEEFYSCAKKLNLLKESIDPRFITLMLFSTLNMLCRRNDLHSKFIGIDLKKSSDFEAIADNLLHLYGHNLLL